MAAETAGQSGPEIRAQIDQALTGSTMGIIQIAQVDQSWVGTKIAGLVTNHELPETDQILVEKQPNLFLQ